MKVLKCILVLVIILTVFPLGYSQSKSNMPERTPEQEAVKQTEKLQQAVQLSPEQVKKAYEINLKYERERQVSNKRSDAIERLKNKNNEINRILNKEQSEQLQSKRYQRSNFELPSTNRTGIPASGSGYRSTTPAYRSVTPANRPGERVVRPSTSGRTIPELNGSRTLNRNYNPGSQQQIIRRNSTSSPTAPTGNPTINRPQSGSYSAPRQTEPTRSTTTAPSSARQSTGSSNERSGSSGSTRRR